MKYYKLSLIGTNCFNGVYMPMPPYEFLKKHLCQLLQDDYVFPETIIIEETPPTQIIAQSLLSVFGFFIDDKVAKIITNANVQNYKIFKGISLQPDDRRKRFKEKYNFLHMVHFDIVPYINVEQTEFWGHPIQTQLERTVYKHNTLDDINAILHDFDTGYDTMPNAKNLFLNHAFFKENIDMFFVPRLVINFLQGAVVSERLKTVLEENEITGIWEFRELPIFLEKE